MNAIVVSDALGYKGFDVFVLILLPWLIYATRLLLCLSYLLCLRVFFHAFSVYIYGIVIKLKPYTIVTLLIL